MKFYFREPVDGVNRYKLIISASESLAMSQTGKPLHSMRVVLILGNRNRVATR